MSLRTFAEFTSELPTGQIESETDFIQLGGQPVAEALAEMLARLGCAVQPVESAGHRGWDFRFRYRKLRLWCQVSLISGYLAVFKDLSAKWRIFGSEHRDFIDLMTHLGEALAADGRFHDLGWFHEHEILSERAGASWPGGPFSEASCARLQAVEEPANDQA